MNRTITPAPVRKSITVQATLERAFEVFTSRIDRWWPSSHHIVQAAPQSVLIEPREGGRWYERGADGTECDIGKVLVWQPPSRLVLIWQLSPDFSFDPKLLTEVEIRFTAAGAGATRVDLEHRDLERFGERAAAMRETIEGPGGWPAILENFARVAGAAE